MYSAEADVTPRRLAVAPCRLFGARQPLARICHAARLALQQWSSAHGPEGGGAGASAHAQPFKIVRRSHGPPMRMSRAVPCSLWQSASTNRRTLMLFQENVGMTLCFVAASLWRQLPAFPLEDHHIPRNPRVRTWRMTHDPPPWPHPIAPPCDLHTVLTAVSWACVPCPVHVHVLLRRCCD